MKKVLFLLLISAMLFTLVGCSGSTVEEDSTANVEVTEDQKRIAENNAVILPKLAELEAVIVEIETFVSTVDQDEKYQSVITQLREELEGVTKNHQRIIDMGGYLEGTAKFEAAVDEAIKVDKEIFTLIKDEVGEKLNNSDVIEETYRNEKLAIINELLPLFQIHLETVSVHFTE